MTHGGITVPLAAFVATLTLGIAVVAWRNRTRPGASPFAGLMVAITYFSLVTPLYLLTLHSGPAPPALVVPTLSVVTAMPLLWLLFVLAYAGYSEYLGRYTLAGLAAPTVLFVALLWSPYRPLIEVGSTHPARTAYVLYVFGYVVLGILLLFRFVVSERRLYTDQAVALVVGIAAPPVGAALEVRGDADLVLAGFAVTGLAFGFALFRFDLFTLLPVTRRLGRDNAVEDLGEGVFILDPEGTVVDLNRSGAGVLGRGRDGLLGASFRPALGEQAPDEGVAPATYDTDDGRTYDVSVSPMQDRQGRTVGHTVVFRDVTDRDLRETQLEVLNRVLRHNLRNKLSAVQGHAELLADGAGEDVLQRHMAATAELMELGERAREFERLKTRDQVTPRRVDLTTAVDGLVAGLREEFPDADVATAVSPDLAVETYPDALDIALQNLLRNAAEHNDRERPRVEVEAVPTDDGVAVEVRDDGPGVPDHELSVLSADAETALQHGSGLGLWITKWAVQYLGGDLAFADNDPRGTVARVTVPASAPGGGREGDAGSTAQE